MADGPRLYARRVGETLVLQPDDVWTADRIYDHLKPDKLIMVRTETGRNPQQHRFIWKLATVISENSDIYPTDQAVMNDFKRWAGRFDMVPSIDLETGRVSMKEELHSMSYAAMPQKDFEEFLARALDGVVTHIWPTLTQLETRALIDEMIGITPSGKTIQRKRKAAAENEPA